MVGFQNRVSNGKNPWAFHPFAGESGPKKSVFLHGMAQRLHENHHFLCGLNNAIGTIPQSSSCK